MVDVINIFFAAICNIHALKMIEVNGMASQDAIQRVMTAHGNQVTLSCDHMTADRAPLRYCQFEPPAGKPFNIDSDVKPEKAILERYYFPPNKTLSRGDCALFIHKVEYQDMGRWTCAAGLDDGYEIQGTIMLQLIGSYTVPEEAPFAFAAIGGVAFLAVIVAFLAMIVGIIIKQRLRVRTESVSDRLTPIRRPMITVQSLTPSPSTSANYQWCQTTSL